MTLLTNKCSLVSLAQCLLVTPATIKLGKIGATLLMKDFIASTVKL